MKIDCDLLNEHYGDPYHHGLCEGATHSGEAVDSAGNCSIAISMLVTEEGGIDEAWFDGTGCEVCEGLASLICEQVEGAMVGELLQTGYREEWFANLENSGLNHHPCLALPLHALFAALKSNDLMAEDAGQIDFGGPSLREEQ